MTFKEKPLTDATISGSKNPKGKQIEHSHYTTHGDPSPDKFINAVGIVSLHWPKPSDHLKAATALVGGLMRSGWSEDNVKSFLDAISEKTGMDVHIPSKVITFITDKIKKGEKFFGWPKLIELTNQEMVSQLIEELGLRKNDSNESQSSFEILDEPSMELTRPLALIEGRGYAVSWLTVRRKVAQTTDENGEITIHNPPKEITEKRFLIMKDDGELFNTDDNPLSNLGFKVNLNESPPAPKLWSSKGVKLYQEGERVYPKIVFEKLCDVIDTFIDFDRSLADQRTMCEFISCFILATWFLDAFKVISQLYLNGERGSGKTQLLTLISQTSYLNSTCKCNF